MRSDVKARRSWPRMSIFHFVLLGGALVLLAFALLANRRDGETPSQVAHDPEDGKLSAVPVSEESPTEVELPSSARDIPKTAPTREWDGVFALDAVSYTHLTLPTILLV